MEKKPTLESLVVKKNDLIENIANFELSELRLIAYCLAHFDSVDGENSSFKATVKDFKELFPISEKSAYRVVRQTMINISKKPLEFQQGSKKYYYNWFSGFIYDVGQGVFEFKITEEIKPYLLNIKDNFTMYRLKDVYQFRSASAWKLYEILKKWANVREWFCTLDELKNLLNVVGQYKRWDSFRIYLNRAISEINSYSDLNVSFSTIKKERKIYSLDFFIDFKKSYETIDITQDTDTDYTKLKKIFIEAGLYEKTAIKYTDIADEKNKITSMLTLMPNLVKRASSKNFSKNKYLKYISAAIQSELNQEEFFTKKKVIDFKKESDLVLEKLVESGNKHAEKELLRRKK